MVLKTIVAFPQFRRRHPLDRVNDAGEVTGLYDDYKDPDQKEPRRLREPPDYARQDDDRHDIAKLRHSGIRVHSRQGHLRVSVRVATSRHIFGNGDKA